MFKSEWLKGGKVSWRSNQILFDLYHIGEKYNKCLNQLKNTRSHKKVDELKKRLNRYDYQYGRLEKELKQLQLLELISPKE